LLKRMHNEGESATRHTASTTIMSEFSEENMAKYQAAGVAARGTAGICCCCVTKSTRTHQRARAHSHFRIFFARRAFSTTVHSLCVAPVVVVLAWVFCQRCSRCTRCDDDARSRSNSTECLKSTSEHLYLAALDLVRSLCIPGANIYEICVRGDKEILNVGAASPIRQCAEYHLNRLYKGLALSQPRDNECRKASLFPPVYR
jgi:hypothetical protein